MVVEHYAEHVDKDYFVDIVPTLVDNDPCIVGTVIHRDFSENTVFFLRQLTGPYKDPGKETIRGHFAMNCRYNSFHSSDSQINAVQERKLWIY